MPQTLAVESAEVCISVVVAVVSLFANVDVLGLSRVPAVTEGIIRAPRGVIICDRSLGEEGFPTDGADGRADNRGLAYSAQKTSSGRALQGFRVCVFIFVICVVFHFQSFLVVVMKIDAF